MFGDLKGLGYCFQQCDYSKPWTLSSAGSKAQIHKVLHLAGAELRAGIRPPEAGPVLPLLCHAASHWLTLERMVFT